MLIAATGEMMETLLHQRIRTGAAFEVVGPEHLQMPLAVFGRRSDVEHALHAELLPPPLAEAVSGWLQVVAQQGASASLLSTWVTHESRLVPVWWGVVPDRYSRQGSAVRPDALAHLVSRLLDDWKALDRSRPSPTETADPGPELSLLVVEASGHAATAAASALARSIPSYDRRATAYPRRIRLGTVGPGSWSLAPERLQLLVDAVRAAALWHDTPPDELGVDALVHLARAVAQRVGATCRVWRAAELEREGMGGLLAVGRAATREPAMVVLSHEPDSATESQAWVGKGIVYDSGGLSLKTVRDMAGMKGDMAGAAAALAAFEAAVLLGASQRLHAVLCIAENAIGPNALRVDEVIQPYSGKTVEVCNTDAEGRLVLADGVAYAARHLNVDVLVDLATLTDAAVIATGRRIAAIVSNDTELEARAVEAGRRAGELVHPLPYVPELFGPELESPVADLRNVGKDSLNGNACCAARFIAEHLGERPPSWLHVDLEGPARTREGRGTGFGVGLLLALLGLSVHVG